MIDPVEVPPAPRRRVHPLLRALFWLVAGVLALVGIAIYTIDTSPGHRLITERIAALKIKTGLRIHIGRIDGSIWDHAVLRDVRLYDLDGLFFESPEIRLDWHPFAWAHNKLDIDSLAADLVTLQRLPHLRATPNAPLLPGFDIRIGKLAITRARLGRAVAGNAAAARLMARADIHDRRVLIGLNLTSDKRDRLRLDMDAMPDGDRFKLVGMLDSPSGGVIGGLFGTKQPIQAQVDGAGGWHSWDGRGTASIGGKTLADLSLTAREGRYGLSGMLAPAPHLQGTLQRLTAPRIAVAAQATLADRQIDGHLSLSTPALSLGAKGRIDLAQSSFAGFGIDLALLKPSLLVPNMSGQNIRLAVNLDGPFKTAAYRFALTAPHLAFDKTGFEGVRIAGSGHVGKLPLTVPIKLQAAHVSGLGPEAGAILNNFLLEGPLEVSKTDVSGTGLKLSSDKLKGKLGIRLDLATGKFDVALSGGLQRYFIPGLGIVDVDTVLSVKPGANGKGVLLTGHGTADVRRFDNAFLRSLAGGLPHMTTRLVRNPDGSLRFEGLVLTGPSIRIEASGLRRNDGSIQLAGTGHQAIYGNFRIALDGMIDHPQVRLLFERPVPALGLTNVKVDLDPIPLGFTFTTAGGSYLGPFSGKGTIKTPPGGLTSIDVETLAVAGTRASGTLLARPEGIVGQLRFAGGGIGGTLDLSPQGTIQKIEPHLAFAGATLASTPAILVKRGRLDGTILLDPAATKLDLTGQFGGISGGKFQLARLGLRTHLIGSNGTVSVIAAGARGKSFAVAADATLAPGRVTVTAKGDVDGEKIDLGGPAQLTAEGDGWRLAPLKLTYRGGTATIGGHYGSDSLSADVGLDNLPLALLDVINPNAQLAGSASGHLTYAGGPGQLPTGRADLTVRGLSRSGLVLASQPIDLGLAAVLTQTGAAMRAVASSGGKTIGRAQGRISPLPPGGDLMSRMGRAPLFAQLRYDGPGDILWRLLGVRTISLSGPLAIGADVGGTLDAPQIKGSVNTSAGRIESATTGTIIQNVQATGRFDGSRLVLDKMSGTTPNGGTVSGRGAFDLSLGAGVGIDLAVQTENAQLLNRDDIAMTVSGPITIRSDGREGTVGGDITILRGSYRLGGGTTAQVSHLNVMELNQTDDDSASGPPPTPWNLDIKARASSRLMVTGLGLDSEWRTKLTVKGAVNNPAISGTADLVRGVYQFAGRRFDLTRGAIRFTGDAPPDPLLDITAAANITGLSASIHVSGTGLRPEISFESTPAMPEDELLARMLFGTSITNLSAPEALQLAAAVAALRNQGNGKGMNLDPINAVRRVVHLDRLRVVPADVTTGQKTSIAAGKYIGRRTYVEVITDGQGYSATSLEYRITRWLSVLSTISTINRQSVNLRVSKDY